MTDASSPYIVPEEPGRWRAILLATLVHAALLAFLWVGVHWQNETPTTIEAEVWDPQPREAAPLPKPLKTSEPRPDPIIKETPKPKVIEPPIVKPDIALEREKKRKAEDEKKRRDEEDRQEKEKQRFAEEKRAKLKAEKEEKAKKEAADKKRKQEEETHARMMEKIREEDMRRMGAGGNGDAPKAQGGRASAEYAGRIAAKIRANTVYVVPEGMAGNPPVEYIVELLPDGTLRAAPRKLKSSGIAGFDEAVVRAIDKSQPFPRDEKTGTVPSSVIVSHKPKDQ